MFLKGICEYVMLQCYMLEMTSVCPARFDLSVQTLEERGFPAIFVQGFFLLYRCWGEAEISLAPQVHVCHPLHCGRACTQAQVSARNGSGDSVVL